MNRVRISEIFAPYKTDSRVGRSDTEISGLYSFGRNREVKKVMSHVKTGTAGKKN